MLTCIACSKQLRGDAGEDVVVVEPTARGTPRTKEAAVKSLTSQIKEMVLKFSGSYRQSKPCVAGASSSSSSSAAYGRKGGGSSTSLQYCRPYGAAGMDAAWEVADAGAGPYQLYARSGCSTSSTPGWDFTCVDAESADARFANGCGRRWVVPGTVGVPPGRERGREESGGLFDEVVMEDQDGEPKEWVAQVEPGVHITFLSLPGGGNDLKRIRFSREMFNKWQAQRWWGENYDRIMELYNVQRFSRQALPTPPRSEDEREYQYHSSSYSRVGSTRESSTATNGRPARGTAGRNGRSAGGGGAFQYPVPDPTEHILQYYYNFPMVAPAGGACSWTGDYAASAVDVASMTTASTSRDEAGSTFSVSNASDQEATEWVEQDEPGVYITLRQLPDGTRELRRVRFSREQFAERNAKQWWELNRERIQAQYL